MAYKTREVICLLLPSVWFSERINITNRNLDCCTFSPFCTKIFFSIYFPNNFLTWKCTYLGISRLSRANGSLWSTKVTTALEEAILEAESWDMVLLNATSFIGGLLYANLQGEFGESMYPRFSTPFMRANFSSFSSFFDDSLLKFTKSNY